MGVEINNGNGGQYKATVNKDGQLETKSITETEFEFESEKNGNAYSWSSGTYDADAGDTILLIKNTSTTKNLFIDRIYLSTDTETRVVVHLPTTNVTIAGTTITGVNLNATSNNVADASAARDETGNSQGGSIWSGEIQAGGNPFCIEFNGACILGTNNSIGVDYIANVAACDVVIMGHYK